MVAVGCETEPVSNNEEFLAYAKDVLDAVDTGGPAPRQSWRTRASSCPQARGEHAVVGTARFERVDGGAIAAYAHPPANKIGVLVQLRGGDAELGRKVAMHIAASPSIQWIGRDDVPAETVGSEREIYANSDEVQSKPEQAREKIVEGMLNKRFFAQTVLTDQEWIHDGSKTVGQALAGGGRRGSRVRTLPAGMSLGAETSATTARSTEAGPFRRVLLKLSGEALAGNRAYGVDQHRVEELAQEIVEVQRRGSRSRW